MRYSSPVCTPFSTAIRCCGRLFLSIPFCLSLFGCDNQAASTSPMNIEAVSQTDGTAHVIQQTHTEPPVNEDESNTGAIDDESHNGEGQSLMAAAMSVDSTNSRRSPMISEQRDNTLQATLIGDYVGMLPCGSCDSIAVTLNLFSDGSVLKTSIYDNPEMSQLPIAESGIYRQDNDTITIVYEKGYIEIYDIQDNHLVMLDDDKVANADYTLSRK